jgi:hypothetical protein
MTNGTLVGRSWPDHALVKPSESDLKARAKALNEVVLARWAKR